MKKRYVTAGRRHDIEVPEPDTSSCVCCGSHVELGAGWWPLYPDRCLWSSDPAGFVCGPCAQFWTNKSPFRTAVRVETLPCPSHRPFFHLISEPEDVP